MTVEAFPRCEQAPYHAGLPESATLDGEGESPPYQSSSPSVATQLKPDLLPVLADRGAISFRNVGTKSTPHPAKIVPKRDAHHILTPGYVKIILWLEYSL